MGVRKDYLLVFTHEEQDLSQITVLDLGVDESLIKAVVTGDSYSDSISRNISSSMKTLAGGMQLTCPINNNKYSWTLCHSISAIDHTSLDGAV